MPKLLTTRLLAPACVLKECQINDVLTLMDLTELPSSEAIYRLKRMEVLKQRDQFYLSEIEIKVVAQFQEFITDYNSSHML